MRRSAPVSAGCPRRRRPCRRRARAPRSARRRWSGRRGPACRPGSSAGRPSCSPSARRPRARNSRQLGSPAATAAGLARRPSARGSCRTPRAARAPTRPSSLRPARAAIVGTIRFSSPSSGRAAAASAASAASTAACVAPCAPARAASSICCASTAGSTTRMPPSRIRRQRRELGLGEAVLPDDDLLARLDAPDPLAVRVDQRRLHVGTASTAPPCSATTAISARAPSSELRDERRPSPASPRRCRRTRAGRSRTRAPAGCAATTAGPTGGAARAPRSTPAAGSRAPARRGRA